MVPVNFQSPHFQSYRIQNVNTVIVTSSFREHFYLRHLLYQFT